MKKVTAALSSMIKHSKIERDKLRSKSV